MSQCWQIHLGEAPQVGLCHAQGDGADTWSPTPLVDMDSNLTFASPVHTQTHTETHTHIHMQTHKCTKSKAKSHKSTRGGLMPLPEGGLMPHRWGCTMPRVIAWAPEVPPGPHPLANMDLRSSYYQVPIDVTAGWTTSLVNTRSSFTQLSRLEQCK